MLILLFFKGDHADLYDIYTINKQPLYENISFLIMNNKPIAYDHGDVLVYCALDIWTLTLT